MSFVPLYVHIPDHCSGHANQRKQLRNGSRARLHQISVPHTKKNLGLLTVLLKNGFIGSLTLGDTLNPDPEAFKRAGVAQKRIWGTLKYADDRPVLGAHPLALLLAHSLSLKVIGRLLLTGNLQIVSRPSKRIMVNPEELLRLQCGQRAQFVKPMGIGEIAIVHSQRQQKWLDGSDAIRENVSGELVARAGPL